MKILAVVLLFFLTACAGSAPAPVHMGTKAGYEYAPRGNYVPPVETKPLQPAIPSYSQQPLPPQEEFFVDILQVRTPQDTNYYTVRQGETLYGIARQNKTDVRALIKENSLEPPYDIEVGQRLKMPQSGARLMIAETNNRQQEFNPRPLNAQQKLEKLEPLGVPPLRTNSRFAWPVIGRVISGFGAQEGGQRNDGINIDAAEGTPVRAAESAVVAYAGNQIRGFGNLVLLKHSDGWITTYAHNRKILVKRGERVEKGQVIAESGATGNVKTPQLHFEVRQGKKALDPMKYLEHNQLTQL
jgi:murein DD-endopeptidase MepM/ murein hydrolase activator NlpD